jgi:ribose transport system permease protein
VSALVPRKALGILILLAVVILYVRWHEPAFWGAGNVQNALRWTGLFGVISLGAAFVIITGGIDLSIGSVVGLSGTLLAVLLTERQMSTPAALGLVALASLGIGLAHGLLITKLKLQPFIVTLCGLLICRGLARHLTDDQTIGFGKAHPGLQYLASGRPLAIGGVEIPMPFLILLGLAAAAAIFLNLTVWGRYLQALGRNEQAARYSGIDTERMTIVAYVLCAGLSGLGGVLFSQETNSIQPGGFGEFYELYAIAAAVLGGCSLRGGEGSILGVLIGAALMRVLYNAINVMGIQTYWEFAIIGSVILAGVVADELVRRWMARRKKAARAA